MNARTDAHARTKAPTFASVVTDMTSAESHVFFEVRGYGRRLRYVFWNPIQKLPHTGNLARFDFVFCTD